MSLVPAKPEYIENNDQVEVSSIFYLLGIMLYINGLGKNRGVRVAGTTALCTQGRRSCIFPGSAKSWASPLERTKSRPSGEVGSEMFKNQFSIPLVSHQPFEKGTSGFDALAWIRGRKRDP